MSEDSRKKKAPDSSYLNARNSALRLLSYRSRSEREVGRRLQGRFTEDAINQTIATLRNQGLLNDMSFAREWREKRERFKPRGAVVIGRELRKLGVDNAIIQEALSDFDASSNAYQAGSKYAGKLPLDDKSVFKRKLGGFLHRRGFNGEVLGLTVERIWRELLDPLNRHVQGDGQHD